MVIAQLGVAPDDAMALLRAHAFAQGATLSEVAALVVQRRLDFSAPDHTTGSDDSDVDSGDLAIPTEEDPT